MIEILLIICLIYITIRFISLKKQLQIVENKTRNKEKINITLNDKALEKLSETINITLQDKKELEIAIRNREERLKQAISDISHDLRTPLAAIRGYLTLLENCKEEEKKGYINILQRKSEELNKLVNNFYEISILDNISYEIETKAVDIVEIITDTVITNYTLIKEKNIDFHNQLADRKIEIQGEEIACGRIIQNLIFNAIKYSKSYMSISIKEFEDNTTFIIKNDVYNLKKSDLKYLFQRFYTVDKSRNSSGTGLGLFIVKILLEKIGGDIKEINLENDILTISILFRNFKE